MDMLDSYKHRLRKAAAAFCAAAFLLGSVPAARAASVCPPPQVSAACAALIDGRTGQTLYEKDADRRALIASTTKIMTGLLVCEAGEADRRVTVPAAAVGLEGSSMVRSGHFVMSSSVSRFYMHCRIPRRGFPDRSSSPSSLYCTCNSLNSVRAERSSLEILL